MFQNRKFTKTAVNQSAGKKLSSDTLKGRVFESNLADLNTGGLAYKKIRLVVDDASESKSRLCLTNFYGMDTTRDHLCSLIRKWHTIIEAVVDAKTTDGFLLRFFPVAFTKRSRYQLKATTYAKRSHVRQIRKKMAEVIIRQVSRSTLKDLVVNLINEKIAVDIVEQSKKIFPLNNCIIRKVKTIKRPRFDISQLLSIQSDMGVAVTEKATTEVAADENSNLLK